MTALPARAEPLRAELERARKAHKPVCVLAIAPRLPRALAGDQALASRVLNALFELQHELAPPGGLVSIQGIDAVIVLLHGARLDDARNFAEALITRSFGLRIEGLDPRVGCAPCVGLSLAEPTDVYSLETLLAVAIEGSSVARARGGACSAHTELYALCEAKLAREGAANLAQLFPRADPIGLRAAPTREPVKPELRPQPVAPPRPAPIIDAAPAVEPELPRSEQVDRLERRIAKLVHQLEESERKFSALALAKAPDTGNSSVYRDVQGLDAQDSNFTMKSELMEQILLANLELRAVRDAKAGTAA